MQHPLAAKIGTNFAASGGCAVGIVCLQTPCCGSLGYPTNHISTKKLSLSLKQLHKDQYIYDSCPWKGLPDTQGGPAHCLLSFQNGMLRYLVSLCLDLHQKILTQTPSIFLKHHFIFNSQKLPMCMDHICKSSITNVPTDKNNHSDSGNTTVTVIYCVCIHQKQSTVHTPHFLCCVLVH
jgi:hypothetical protein